MGTGSTTVFTPLITSFSRSLRARNLSPKTISVYVGASEALARWLTDSTEVRDWPGVRKADLETWVAFLLDTRAPGHASNQYRAVQQLFKWLAAEEEIAVNPMASMSPPKLPETLVPVLTDDQLRALFRTCAGKDLVSRRDLAILRLFVSSGMRLAELAGLEVTAVDLDERIAVVVGKGRRAREVKFDATTTMAIDRYLRLRARDRHANRPELWLAEKGRGPLTRTGVYQMVGRRGDEAGIDHLHPHVFRHTFSHRYLAAGGAEGDLMQQTGWRSPQMVRRYGASAKAERARTAYDRVGVMDGL